MIPQAIFRLFWGDNLKELNWKKNKDYIAKTILEKGDKASIRWLLKKAGKLYLKDLVKSSKLDPK